MFSKECLDCWQARLPAADILSSKPHSRQFEVRYPRLVSAVLFSALFFFASFEKPKPQVRTLPSLKTVRSFIRIFSTVFSNSLQKNKFRGSSSLTTQQRPSFYARAVLAVYPSTTCRTVQLRWRNYKAPIKAPTILIRRGSKILLLGSCKAQT